ncbi:RagB/SusD family nutrient uptake outer membrane protein [Tamlana sp. I1]|uniref:RagB/SusD family nutrient uptake outer membrane protein n=1 Tax=Tamlana sp. I1 TaxID=2762061 RepID=UPI00188ED76D|nr:RagB/SusD family nutrient uptake outer membrane protein [Tamlana sp. I1]
MRKVNYNRLFITALFSISAITMGSCDVDVVQKDSTTTLDLSENDVIEIAYNVKDVLKWQSSNSPSANSHTFGIMFQDIRGGNAVSEKNPVNWISGRDFNQFSTITPSQPSVYAFWSKWFKGINRANASIENLTNYQGFSNETLRKNLIAQSKFFRAYFYFELAKNFGAVPIRLEAVTNLNQATALPRPDSVNVVYDQIISDLLEAVSDLDNNPSEKYEATQGAAYALLAKVSLYKKDYSKAIDYANMVSGYTLESEFVDNFRLSTEGHRNETILEVPYTQGLSGLGFESAAETSEMQGSGIYQMAGGIGGVNSTWNNMLPTKEFVDFFVANDKRKLGTLVVGGEPQEGLTGAQTQIIAVSFPNVGAIQRKYYLTPDEIARLNATGNTQQCDINDLILRFADVLLIKAEAQIMLNGPGAGDAALGQVISRAGLPLSSGYTMNDIKYNRRAELSFEGLDRFSDLVRWGDASTVLSEKGFTTGRDELLPIPQLEIDQSVGVITQNPGY